ncbi:MULTISPECIES: DUF1440 domain-containing protein [unclassified Sphingomonas]|uniref:DUF1440 domain-containing protein n=1 Tax=unclassified Sphingomonas TaxID=196159 RepID=UPI00226AEE91
MRAQDKETTDKILRGALSGLIAGATASFVMDRFQAAVAAMASKDGDGDAEPATEKAADGIARTLTGGAVSQADKPLAGQAVHYALGIGLGIAYGVAAEFQPAVTTGFGAVFGLGTATVMDEAVVPALGLGPAPWKAGIGTNLYAYASHLVFGGTTELVRSQVASTLRS